MTKDPAFLFYSSDFLTGTMFMSNEQTGIYIKLLCIQHQHGDIIDNAEFDNIVGDDIKLRSKFIKVDNGYKNQRLSDELNKRKMYCDSRRSNRMSNIRQTHDKHMIDICQTYDQHMENENINSSVCNTTHTPESSNQVIKDIVYKRFVVPSIEDVKAYCVERGNSVDAEKWMDYYQSNGWKVGRNPMKDWKAAVRTWEKSGFRDKEMSAYDFTVAEGKKLIARVKAQELAKEKEQKKGEDYVDARNVDQRVKSLISGI